MGHWSKCMKKFLKKKKKVFVWRKYREAKEINETAFHWNEKGMRECNEIIELRIIS